MNAKSRVLRASGNADGRGGESVNLGVGAKIGRSMLCNNILTPLAHRDIIIIAM